MVITVAEIYTSATVTASRSLPASGFEYVGPMNAGRFAAAAAIAGTPGVYFAGAASGGVWKSSDGGATWKPTFDDRSSQPIGALAVSQSNPNIVWAGTGEASSPPQPDSRSGQGEKAPRN